MEKCACSRTGGNLFLSTGAVAGTAHSGNIQVVVGESESAVGGDVDISAGNGLVGGSVNIASGNGETSGEMLFESGDHQFVMGSQGVSLTSGGGADMKLTVSGVDDQRGDRTISLGFHEEELAPLRVTETQDGAAVIVNDPLLVTSVEYSSDQRIKSGIQSVDTRDLLQRMNSVQLREYGYTPEWSAYRALQNPDDNVDVDGGPATTRGVIAQELETVFPEHVGTISQDPAGLGLTDFRQVDKQGLVLDLIGALQAQSERFSVDVDDASKTGDIAVTSATAGSQFTSTGYRWM